MTLFLTGVRNPKEAEISVNEFLKTKNIQGNVIYEKLDVGNMTSVREFAKVIREKHSKIDLLINNGNLNLIIFMCIFKKIFLLSFK